LITMILLYRKLSQKSKRNHRLTMIINFIMVGRLNCIKKLNKRIIMQVEVPLHQPDQVYLLILKPLKV